ncbi:MAG TPA: alpha/beta hydrolase, partial [Thermoanaerobaculia bacterium]|nr:alpha/beta hydrolase [Thermoanaerobaculia bacterium]
CQSGRERVVCNRSLELLARHLPRARLVLFKDAEHEVMMEVPAVRERFFAEVEGFLGEALSSP